MDKWYSADITGFLIRGGTYIGLVTSEGRTIQLKDSSGNIVPFNKESVENFIKNHPPQMED